MVRASAPPPCCLSLAPDRRRCRRRRRDAIIFIGASASARWGDFGKGRRLTAHLLLNYYYVVLLVYTSSRIIIIASAAMPCHGMGRRRRGGPGCWLWASWWTFLRMLGWAAGVENGGFVPHMGKGGWMRIAGAWCSTTVLQQSQSVQISENRLVSLEQLR